MRPYDSFAVGERSNYVRRWRGETARTIAAAGVRFAGAVVGKEMSATVLVRYFLRYQASGEDPAGKRWLQIYFAAQLMLPV